MQQVGQREANDGLADSIKALATAQRLAQLRRLLKKLIDRCALLLRGILLLACHGIRDLRSQRVVLSVQDSADGRVEGTHVRLLVEGTSGPDAASSGFDP